MDPGTDPGFEQSTPEPGQPTDPTPRRGAGCATAFGVLLIAIGATALAVNVYGSRLALGFLDLVPVLAVWWPAVLIVWGVAKVAQRLVTGRARFGCLEAVLLILVLLAGLGLSTARWAIERQGLASRFEEVRRWAHQQAEPLPQHGFVIERTVPLPAGVTELAVRLEAGGVLVRASSGTAPGETPPASPAPATRLTLTKRVWAATAALAEERAGQVRLVTGPVGSGGNPERLLITVDDPGDFDVAFDLEVEAPPEVGISVVSGQGAVRVEGPFARVSAETAHGPLEVRGTMGEAQLTARDGSVLGAELGGPVRIRARRSAVEVVAAAGTVSIESEGSPVWAEGVAGSVTVEGRGGSVNVTDAAGEVRVNNEIGPVALRRIGGPAWVRSAYGPVLVEEIEGTLEVRGTDAFLEVRDAAADVSLHSGAEGLLVEGVDGPLEAVTEGGDAFASRLGGEAFLSVGDGDLFVERARGPLRIEGGDGALGVSLTSVDDDVSVSSARGGIRLEVARGSAFELEVASGEGTVESDFELDRTADANTATASVGTGGPLVRLTTAGGDVRILASEDREPAPGGAPDVRAIPGGEGGA